MSQIADPQDWVTTATTEASGAKVFQQGPDLPNKDVDIVQASGGHDNPVFYVSESKGLKEVWKWTAGQNHWEPITLIGSTTTTPPSAQRFFVDPFRPDILYILGPNRIYLTTNGGNSWTFDHNLEKAMTENGNFPFNFAVSNTRNPGEALIRDMLFDPVRPNYRFAIGPAGVFYTTDGINWSHLLLTKATPMRPNNGYYDIYSNPK